MALITCKECGATHAESADSCPQCGADQGPGCLWQGVGFIVVCFILSLLSSWLGW